MNKIFKDNWKVIKSSLGSFAENNPFQHSAAIAFYTIFSLPGMALIAVLIASSFYERDVVREELLNQVSLLMGTSSANQVEALMNKALVSNDSFVMKLIGAGTLLVSTTTVFVSLQDSFNSIWKIRPKPKRGIVKFLFNRLLSLALVASIGFLLLVSLTADTLLAIFKDVMSYFLEESSYYIIWLLNTGFSLVVITFIFAALFKVLPDAQIKWRHVWVGAMVTTVLFIIGKYLIGFYLGSSSLTDVYGAAGSLVALLAWVYYSVLIVLYGTQFTMTYNSIKGEKIKPNEEAVVLNINEVEEKGATLT